MELGVPFMTMMSLLYSSRVSPPTTKLNSEARTVIWRQPRSSKSTRLRTFPPPSDNLYKGVWFPCPSSRCFLLPCNSLLAVLKHTP